MRHNILTISLFVALLVPGISFAKTPSSKKRPAKSKKKLSHSPTTKPSTTFGLCMSLYRKRLLLASELCFRKQLKSKTPPSKSYYMLGVLLSKKGYCCCPDSSSYSKNICLTAGRFFRSYVKNAPNSPQAKKVKRMLGE